MMRLSLHHLAITETTPSEFVDSILVGQLGAKGIIEGPNFCFGKDRAGEFGRLYGELVSLEDYLTLLEDALAYSVDADETP